MELEVLEQHKNVFSVKSPTSFFAAFRRKPRAKPFKVEEEIHSHKGSFLNTITKDEEQTARSMSTWAKEGQTFDMWSDLSSPKDPKEPTKPLRKSILIRTTSLPISNKKPLEETTTLKETSKGPLKKMAMWLGGMKESAKSNPCSLTDNLAREKKNKKVTFAIEEEANRAAEQLLSLKTGKKPKKAVKPTLEGDLEDTSIEFLETNETPFGDLRFRPTPNNDYLFHPVAPESGFRQKVTTKLIGSNGNQSTRNIKHSDIISSSDSETEIDNDFGLKARSSVKTGRRQTTEDHSTKLPMIAAPLPVKNKNHTISDLQPEGLQSPTGARKLGSFSVRGASTGTSTVNLANMLYPIKRNIRLERDINRDYDFNADKIWGNDSDFSSKVIKQSMISQRDPPLLCSEPNLRLLMNAPNYPKSPSLTIGKRHASLGVGGKAAEL